MSDKGRVFKAHFTINDNVHHCQLNEHFTTARRDNESLHHFILRLLGFCLFAYRHDLTLCDAREKPQRDVYAKNDFDDYELVIEVFTGDIKVLNKLYREAQQLYVITVLPVDSELQHWLLAHQRVELIAIENAFIERLEAMLARSLAWHVSVDSDEISITANDVFVRSALQVSWF
ncbi:YaeQ family protein [Pseudoalteromonas sp. CNC9-20]|uniref:YaeQ family protein n=1 Tax=Pseudoalteromonas sp. CNC9-20 TaxID=2917750 RepID=UPI001EF64D72|nr:YaeQ family protein [Pseudoalteromonas sp. CNC9-20]MCG7568851.1 YaeQ family protein [Pseudoalteromonas sp. CNC9-20]